MVAVFNLIPIIVCEFFPTSFLVAEAVSIAKPAVVLL